MMVVNAIDQIPGWASRGGVGHHTGILRKALLPRKVRRITNAMNTTSATSMLVFLTDSIGGYIVPSGVDTKQVTKKVTQNATTIAGNIRVAAITNPAMVQGYL